MTSTTSLLDTLEQEPDGSALASVIWLHGLGADGHDFASLPPQLGVSPELGIRYVFPHAPVIPVTVNMGTRMRAYICLHMHTYAYVCLHMHTYCLHVHTYAYI